MKQVIIVVLALLALTSCSSEKKYSIDFCTSLNSDIECSPSDTIFHPGDRVYVLFESDQPFTEKLVTGKFYYVSQDERIHLGSQDWKIKPGDSYAYDYVDFTEEGVYEFQFINAEGVVLAQKRLEIK